MRAARSAPLQTQAEARMAVFELRTEPTYPIGVIKGG
jgi:hypothetical protein